jgi:hypothetical protein
MATRSRERGPNRLSGPEIERTVKSVIKGGGKVKRVTVRPGEVTVYCGEEGEAANAAEHNEWDEELYGKDQTEVRLPAAK